MNAKDAAMAEAAYLKDVRKPAGEGSTIPIPPVLRSLDQKIQAQQEVDAKTAITDPRYLGK